MTDGLEADFQSGRLSMQQYVYVCRKIIPQNVRNYALMLVVLAVSVGLAELATRFVLKHPKFVEFSADHVDGLISYHPTRGSTYTPNFSGKRVTSDYTHGLEINALGMRDKPLDVNALPRSIILAVGNSFTAGLGVERDEAWPARLETLLADGTGVRVVNAAVSGHSLKQIRIAAKELVPLLSPKLVVAGVFIGGADRLLDPYVFFHGAHVKASKVKYLKPAEGGFLFQEPRSPSNSLLNAMLDWLKEHTYLGAYLIKCFDRFVELLGADAEVALERGQAAQAKQLMLDELARLKVLTARLGVPLVVLFINNQHTDGGFNDDRNSELASFCKELNIHVVDPSFALREAAGGKPTFRFARDGHWTSQAHAIAAAELAPLAVTLIAAGGNDTTAKNYETVKGVP